MKIKNITPALDGPAPEDPDALEPLPGQVIPQFIRCGKPTCHCITGQKHGPYFYRVWREGSKVCKAYVRLDDVVGVQAQTRLYGVLESELRRLGKLRLVVSIHLREQRHIRRELLALLAKDWISRKHWV